MSECKLRLETSAISAAPAVMTFSIVFWVFCGKISGVFSGNV